MANANKVEVAKSTEAEGDAPQPKQDHQLVDNSQRSGGGNVKRPGDVVFETLAKTSSILITVIIALIGLFLILQAVPAMGRLRDGIFSFFTYGERWNTDYTTNDGGWMQFGIPNMFFSTVTIALIGLIIAMPVALGVALFLSNYAPKQLVRPLGTLIDMLAAVPSIVFGLWGAKVLGPMPVSYTHLRAHET